MQLDPQHVERLLALAERVAFNNPQLHESPDRVIELLEEAYSSIECVKRSMHCMAIRC